MKKFNFSLEKVLEYRGQLEASRLRAFATAMEVFRERQRELNELGRELTRYRNELAAMGVGRVPSRVLAQYRSYLSHCERQVAEAADWMMKAAREMEGKRRELVAATKDKRVIERLKQIKRLQYDYEVAREEIKELDEVAARGFLAGQMAGGGGA